MPIEITAVPKEYYLVEETATMMKMNSQTILRYIREKKLQAKKMGRVYWITGSSILALVGNQGEVQSAKSN